MELGPKLSRPKPPRIAKRTRFLAAATLAGVAWLGQPAFGNETPAKQVSSELAAARREGWTIAAVLIAPLRAGNSKSFPGIAAWLKDFDRAAARIDAKRPPAEWASIDVDTLVDHNPNFWQAYFEIAPADPGLLLLHAALLLSDGEATRATHLIVIAKQRGGIPKQLQAAFGALLSRSLKAGEESNRLVAAGTKLHDNKDYKGAMAKYREALVVSPQNGLAHYELGYSLDFQHLVAAGAELPPPDSVQINTGRVLAPDVLHEYAQARRHDPFQINAYQGSDPEVIRGFLALSEKGMPAWREIAAHIDRPASDELLGQLAAACQQAHDHELALTIRQILVARRGQGFSQADQAFVGTSLRKLAPGNQTERVIKGLGAEAIEVRQLVAPE